MYPSTKHSLEVYKDNLKTWEGVWSGDQAGMIDQSQPYKLNLLAIS